MSASYGTYNTICTTFIIPQKCGILLQGGRVNCSCYYYLNLQILDKADKDKIIQINIWWNEYVKDKKQNK